MEHNDRDLETKPTPDASPAPMATSPSKIKSSPRAKGHPLLVYTMLFSITASLTTVFPSTWLLFHTTSSKAALDLVQTDPATEWKDNIWPLHQQTPWDISTDYSYPRKLEYDVTEGTWLRLDVHPTSGDIVFDMVGDIYCLPGSQALQSNGQRIRARPILVGIPHDSDPRFSPTGDRLVFRSDAELGVENIWVTEWKGCEEMDVRPTGRASMEKLAALVEQAYEEDLLIDGIKEDFMRKKNRLIREGRLNAQRVTNETYRWVTDARFHPSGDRVIATKWYTTRRSLGTGEGWEYDVPSVHDLRAGKITSITAGSGSRLVSRSLPLGWTSQDYGEQQIGPEQFIWKGTDGLVFAKNVIDSARFTYSKDVHKGIYAIFHKNLTTDTIETLVEAFPGGASRPELSRNGRTLAFVRRIRDKEALALKDLQTGSVHNVWYGLTYDVSVISATMGTYPTFAFAPSDDAVVIWAAGQIYSVPLSVNTLGEKVASSSEHPKPIAFAAHIEKRLAKTRSGGMNLVDFETQDTQEINSLQDLHTNDKGTRVVFQAAGTTYWQDVGRNTSGTVPVNDEEASYYSPTFVPGEDDLVLHARWSDTMYTTFEIADIKAGTVHDIVVPFGRYFSPIICQGHGLDRTIAFLKTGGSYLSGDIIATGGPGLYLGDITLPDSVSTKAEKISIRNLRLVPSEIEIDSENTIVNMRFIHKNEKLLVQQSDRAFIIDLVGKSDVYGKPSHTTIASGKMSTELAVDPGVSGAYQIAFVDFYHVYIVPGDHVKDGESVWSRPGNATKGIARLSLDGGHSITFTADGKRVFWFLGPYLHSLEISKLHKCSSAIENDSDTFGISCVKSLLDFQKVDNVKHTTDIARLKKQAAKVTLKHKPWLNIEQSNFDVVVLYNATLLTMESGNDTADLIQAGVLVVRGGVIEYAGPLEQYVIPTDATVIDLDGGYVVPGFIDIHAHWNGFSDRYPAKSWEMETFLSYGITTLHNPSADTVAAFSERSRVESGQMIGPRIFTTGIPVYGAGQPGFHQEIVDMDEAASALIRIKVEGGPASISYKNYNLPSRASRQRLLAVAQNMGILCFPEGGMNYDWDLTYIIDGMTTIEHALPVPILYDDVLTLYALSGTGSTPTHIVNYGGAWGEQLVWATEDVPNDPKLRRFTRHDILEGLTETISRPKESYALFNTSFSVAAMVKKGLVANIGAHGEPPLGVNYHAEMGFTGSGGLSNYEVIRAATSSGARTLGVFSSLGSLSSGKLADFLVYPPGVDLLEGEISDKTRQIRLVARGGRIWEAETMMEFWPAKGKKQTMPVFNAD